MPDTPTPGELAFEAYWKAFKAMFGTHGDDPWATIHPGTQRAWAAAAQAVLAMEKGESEKIMQALTLAVRYGQIDGAHHKAWVIDQMCRALVGTDDAYRQFVAEACTGDEGPHTYDWNEGIAP